MLYPYSLVKALICTASDTHTAQLKDQTKTNSSFHTARWPLAQAPSKHQILTYSKSCHSYLFYRHHTPSANCMAATTDLTPDSSTQLTGSRI